MGGNALQYVETGRLDAVEYRHAMLRVVATLHRLFPNVNCDIVAHYFNKTSFGDGDIIVNQDRLPVDWIAQVQKAFNPRELVINRLGGTPLTYTRVDVSQPNPDLVNQNIVPAESPPTSCVSFDFQADVHGFRYFQVDLIPTPERYYRSTLNYYAYNDLGNLIGRLAAKMGFKFGWQGLVKVLMSGSNKIAHIEVTRDINQALAFLGYDADRWRKGFSTPEEIYTYAASSPWFHRDLFQLESLNNDNKTRNRKRKTYMGFLDWVADKPELDKYKWYPYVGHLDIDAARDYEHRTWMLEAGRMFPGFQATVERIIVVHQLGQVAKSRFNSDLLSKCIAYEGKTLGHFMAFCQVNYPSFDGKISWNEWVCSTGRNQLMGYIEDQVDLFDQLPREDQEKHIRPRKVDTPIVPIDPAHYEEAVAHMNSLRDRVNSYQ